MPAMMDGRKEGGVTGAVRADRTASSGCRTKKRKGGSDDQPTLIYLGNGEHAAAALQTPPQPQMHAETRKKFKTILPVIIKAGTPYRTACCMGWTMPACLPYSYSIVEKVADRSAYDKARACGEGGYYYGVYGV